MRHPAQRMGRRRFTLQTDGFGRKLEGHLHMLPRHLLRHKWQANLIDAARPCLFLIFDDAGGRRDPVPRF